MATLLLFALIAPAFPAMAADQEGCLFCHRLEIAKAASGVANLRVSEKEGTSHGGLYCSDCHSDAKLTPHAVSPGPARCIDECHAAGAGAVPESHRRAAFSGMTETHRRIAIPSSPCKLCHKDGDPPSAKSPAAARCKGCHPGQASAVSEGVHARLSATLPGGGCAACHLPHPPGASGARVETGATCKKAGCHDAVTDKMKSLAVHGKGGPSERPGRAGALLAFGIAAILGILPGALLCGNRRGAKGGPQ
jgi:hypothetical protein